MPEHFGSGPEAAPQQTPHTPIQDTWGELSEPSRFIEESPSQRIAEADHLEPLPDLPDDLVAEPAEDIHRPYGEEAPLESAVRPKRNRERPATNLADTIDRIQHIQIGDPQVPGFDAPRWQRRIDTLREAIKRHPPSDPSSQEERKAS